jgi:hypothetical protein
VHTENDVHKHFDPRRIFYASTRVDRDTDAYIEHRLTVGKQLNSDLKRSAVLAEMLSERARDETFERSQTILVPLIQDTMRAEFKHHDDRYMALIARISYQVGWILLLLRYFVSYILARNIGLFYKFDGESEKDARLLGSKQSGQIDEVKQRLLSELEGKAHV